MWVLSRIFLFVFVAQHVKRVEVGVEYLAVRSTQVCHDFLHSVTCEGNLPWTCIPQLGGKLPLATVVIISPCIRKLGKLDFILSCVLYTGA